MCTKYIIQFYTQQINKERKDEYNKTTHTQKTKKKNILAHKQHNLYILYFIHIQTLLCTRLIYSENKKVKKKDYCILVWCGYALLQLRNSMAKKDLSLSIVTMQV